MAPDDTTKVGGGRPQRYDRAEARWRCCGGHDMVIYKTLRVGESTLVRYWRCPTCGATRKSTEAIHIPGLGGTIPDSNGSRRHI